MLISYDGVAEAKEAEIFHWQDLTLVLIQINLFDTAHVPLTGLQQKDLYNDDFIKAA